MKAKQVYQKVPQRAYFPRKLFIQSPLHEREGAKRLETSSKRKTLKRTFINGFIKSLSRPGILRVDELVHPNLQAMRWIWRSASKKRKKKTPMHHLCLIQSIECYSSITVPDDGTCVLSRLSLSYNSKPLMEGMRNVTCAGKKNCQKKSRILI